ncbi:MAG: GntR family transcriptional regulator [Bryobacteraceae bacterium]
MRFWITKNSELSVHEQLARQILLAILSEDLPAGRKLPSVRALARRHHIHANTVSAAYHDLLTQGWLELRRGSGLYVRALHDSSDRSTDLDRSLAGFLQNARRHGFEPEEVLQRLDRLVRTRTYERIVIAEPEPAMREILLAEIRDHVQVPVDAVAKPDSVEASQLSGSLVVALPTRADNVRRSLPQGALCVPLRLRSVFVALEQQTMPRPDAVISIVSCSVEIRQWARAMLLAVGLDPDCVCDVDTSDSAWQNRLGASALVVTDVVTARQLTAGCPAKVFRVIADSSIAELKQLCGA